MSSAIVDLLGDNLVSKFRELVPTSSLWEGGDSDFSGAFPEDRVLGLYFSATWCVPCRMFTPDLVSFYTRFKATEKGRQLEMVFVSSDEDEDSFYEYLADMPWPALPFADRQRKSKLSKRFKVQGIPMVVFIDGCTGKLITSCGRECILDDMEGKDFPWSPRSFTEMMHGELLSGEERVDYEEAVRGKVKGIYFSARWCPPCNGFNQELKRVYKRLQEQGKDFEIIYVSSDRTLDSFTEYYREMPWLALPFEDQRVSQLTRRFDVEGVPTLILLDARDEVLNTKGRAAIIKDPEAKCFPWRAPAAEELNEDNASTLNESPCLILFTDEKLGERAADLLLPIATEYRQLVKDNPEFPELCFLYEGPGSKEMGESLRTFAHLEAKGSRLAILNVPEEQLYTEAPHRDITEQSVRQLVDEFKRGRLLFKKFGNMEEAF